MKIKRILLPLIFAFQPLLSIAAESKFILLSLNQAIEQGTKVRTDPAKDMYFLDFTENMKCKPDFLYLYNQEVYPNHIWAKIPLFSKEFFFALDKKYINNTYVSFECNSKSFGIPMSEFMAYNKSLKDAP